MPLQEPSANNWVIHVIPTPSPTWGVLRRGHCHQCAHCGVVLLTGETAGFCCGKNGSRLHDVPPLPPLPPALDDVINDPRISAESRRLNLVFSMASMETTAAFPEFQGPAFLAIQGKVYHRVRPQHQNSAVRWILYDGFLPTRMPFPNFASDLPREWITTVRDTLRAVNPFVRKLEMLHSVPAAHVDARIVLDGAAPPNEIADGTRQCHTVHCRCTRRSVRQKFFRRW